MRSKSPKTLSYLALLSSFGASLTAFGAETFSCPAGTVAQAVDAVVTTAFVSQTETKGSITGQIKGTAGCTILGPPEPQADGSMILRSRGFIHTKQGEIILAPGATTAVLISGTPEAPLLAVRDYPIQVLGGTGAYKGIKSGLLNHIGAVDLRDPQHGKNVFRLDGTLCYAKKASP